MSFVFQTLMSAGTTLAACVLISVKTLKAPIGAAALLALSWRLMAGTVMVGFTLTYFNKCKKLYINCQLEMLIKLIS